MALVNEFKINFPKAEIEDLKTRIRNSRWPERETVDDWSQGVPLDYLKDLTDYWSSDYSWFKTQDRLNEIPQFETDINGLSIHFMHIQSPHKNAKPILITHGWPGSVIEFLKVIEPLTEPTKHGGSEADAFHAVFPSLPGYGFSGKPKKTGWGVHEIADAWNQLMLRLGYGKYYAQGGDWGSAVTTAIGMQNKGNCRAIHLNMPNAGATEEAKQNPTDADKNAFKGASFYQQWDSGYSKQQSTRPQTLGYGLSDSPIGQCAWILEKFYQWTDCNGHPENVITRDELLDNTTLYWLSNSGASSARLYWESFNKAFGNINKETVDIPSGMSIFPKEIVPTPRSWAEKRFTNIRYWNDLDKGGHFAAFEQPELFVNELRSWNRSVG